MGIHEPSLCEAVQRATGGENAEQLSYQATPIASGTSRASVYRVAIDTTVCGQQRALSLIYKRCDNVAKDGRVLAVDDPSWQREALVYQSGLLEDSRGLRAPLCHALTRIEEGAYGLWMEDVGADWSENWSLERYRLAAYHLGYFNGHFVAADKVPNETWLGQSGWREHVEASARALELLVRHRDEAHVAAIYPHPIAADLLTLWQCRKEIIQRARKGSPMSMCHGDSSGRNLYDINGKETVAIDWYYTGLAPLGEDAARCFGSSIHWFFRNRMYEAKNLFVQMGDGYIEGLREAGFSGDEEAVRYAYRAVICTLYGLQYVHNAEQMKDAEAIERWAQSNYGCTGAEAMEHRRQMAAFFVELAREGGLL